MERDTRQPSFGFKRSGARLAATAVLAGGAISCSPAPPEERCVAASIFPLYDIARRVAGDRLRVELVLPPGRTTHYYDPSPREVSRLASASLVFAVGLGLDSWLAPIVESAAGGKSRIFDLGPLVDPRLAPRGPIDPHFWLDPIRMERATDLMVDACRSLDPPGGPGYAARAEEVKASLRKVHAGLVRRAERWRGRRIVTFHGSLYYFADRYGFEIAGVVEPVPGREPTARELAELVALVKLKRVVALFSEPQLDRKAAQVIAREAGVPLFEIDPVGGLPGTDTYEGLLQNIAGALDRAMPVAAGTAS
jgi:zinc transport system substrate-binding protein